MRTEKNNPFPSFLYRGVLVKALVLLTGFQLLAFSYFLQELHLSNAPHTVNQSLPLVYIAKGWTSYDKVSQKLMINQSQEAISKQGRSTFKFAILSPAGYDNVQLYCSALETFEGRIAIKNVIGEELRSINYEFKKGKQVIELAVEDWLAGKYLVQIKGEHFSATKTFEVGKTNKAKYASRF